MKGHHTPHTEEAKKKMSLAKKGRKLTEEHKNKISLKGKGRKLTTEHKEILRQYMKNRVVSEATKQKLRDYNTGRKLTKEHKDKIRNSMVGKIAGDKNPAWKGGVNSLILQIRSSYKSRQWRSDCFYRDDFTCQRCGNRGGKLQVDHIEAFSLIFYRNKIKSLQDALDCEEFWNINNGRTLCTGCHRKTESYGKNTRFQK
jgi:hypothetical protein